MFDWSVISNNGTLWLTGILYTCVLSLVSCVVGTVLAVMLAVAWGSEEKAINRTAWAIVEIFKSIPLLVLLVAIQYVLPILWRGWTLSAFWNSVIALSLSLAAFLAEVLRGGMDAIPKEHVEAAEALGMDRAHINLRVKVPETVRRTFASVVVLYISTLKFSTLASVIGVPELLFSARMVNIQTVRPMEVYISMTVAFVILVFPLSCIGRSLEKHRWFTLTPTSKAS